MDHQLAQWSAAIGGSYTVIKASSHWSSRLPWIDPTLYEVNQADSQYHILQKYNNLHSWTILHFYSAKYQGDFYFFKTTIKTGVQSFPFWVVNVPQNPYVNTKLQPCPSTSATCPHHYPTLKIESKTADLLQKDCSTPFLDRKYYRNLWRKDEEYTCMWKHACLVWISMGSWWNFFIFLISQRTESIKKVCNLFCISQTVLSPVPFTWCT